VWPYWANFRLSVESTHFLAVFLITEAFFRGKSYYALILTKMGRATFERLFHKLIWSPPRLQSGFQSGFENGFKNGFDDFRAIHGRLLPHSESELAAAQWQYIRGSLEPGSRFCPESGGTDAVQSGGQVAAGQGSGRGLPLVLQGQRAAAIEPAAHRVRQLLRFFSTSAVSVSLVRLGRLVYICKVEMSGLNSYRTWVTLHVKRLLKNTKQKNGFFLEFSSTIIDKIFQDLTKRYQNILVI
jgi:hypothetical protein